MVTETDDTSLRTGGNCNRNICQVTQTLVTNRASDEKHGVFAEGCESPWCVLAALRGPVAHLAIAMTALKGLGAPQTGKRWKNALLAERLALTRDVFHYLYIS